VGPAPLTITATSATMTYGGAVPAITAVYGGFVNGDTAASLTTAPTCSTAATSSSPPGTYPATCSGAVDADYAISYTAGTVTVAAAPPTGPPATTTSTTATTAPAPMAFPGAGLSYPNGAIVSFGASDYVFAGGRAFVAGAGSLAAVEKVDHAQVVSAPAGAAPPTGALRAGTLVTTKAVDGDGTIYVAGTDGELHGFSTSAQFFRGGYDTALVVTVPSLAGLGVGATDGVAGSSMTALATHADGAIVDSSGTFYVFAGGKAFGLATPAELVAVEAADTARALSGPVNFAQVSAPIASGVLLGRARGHGVFVSYDGDAYLFKAMGQLVRDGYGGTAAVPVPGPDHLVVISSYSGS
jgi:MBG domain (YGX type)